MSCTNGSQKRIDAPDTINVNDIGTICSLFGLEGPLCRLLDLLPEFIQKVMSLDFKNVATSDVFEKMLAKVAGKTVGLIFDELTGRIDLNGFCQGNPPPFPEEITYYDVYDFFGSVVPILSQFLAVNDFLQGNSTRLLDKIVDAWLYRKWYENCECNSFPIEPYTPPVNTNPFIPIPFIPPPKCPDGSSDGSDRCKNLQLTAINLDHTGIEVSRRSIHSCHGFFSFPMNNGVGNNTPARAWAEAWLPVELQGSSTIVGQDQGLVYKWTETTAYPYPTILVSGDGGITSRPFTGDNDEFSYPICPQNPPTFRPPPTFCSLYPDNELCLNPNNDGNCEVISIDISEFVACDQPRAFRTIQVFNSGSTEQIPISEFTACGNPRNSKELTLFNCQISGNTDYGCTDSNALNYSPLAIYDDGSCAYNVYGCTDPSAVNYDPGANIDDGSCVARIDGCTDSNANNYDPLATYNDGTCTYDFYGCTDPSAINYDPRANVDDGSCVARIDGCTDSSAINYDPLATYDDGSYCIY